jgi:transposase
LPNRAKNQPAVKIGKPDRAKMTDLDRGIALDILPTRSKEALLAHFKALGSDFCQQIESISFDMWPAYHG